MKKLKEKQASEKKQNRGAINLIIMGLLSVLIAVSTTGISLAIYHNSGDIYLDRSRPGYLPDEEEIEGDEDEDVEEYDFSKSGSVTRESLDEYLKYLSQEEKAINAYEKPFDAMVLSDEHLGIVLSDSADGAIKDVEGIAE